MLFVVCGETILFYRRIREIIDVYSKENGICEIWSTNIKFLPVMDLFPSGFYSVVCSF